MKTSAGHRKLVKHYEDPGHLRELTFSCYERRPLLMNDTWREMLSRAIDAAGERHHWRLTTFVFMPEHVHAIDYVHAKSDSPQALYVDLRLEVVECPVVCRPDG